MAVSDYLISQLQKQGQDWMQGLQKKREQQQELYNLVMAAIIKQKFDPEAQFRQQMLGLVAGGGQPQQTQPNLNLGGMGGFQPQSTGGLGGGGFKPKGLTYGGFTFEREPSAE